MGFLNVRAQSDKIDKQLFFFSKMSMCMKEKNYIIENALYDFIHSLRSMRKLTRSLRALVRFLILLNL